MSASNRSASLNTVQKVDICIGEDGTPVGSLTNVRQGQRKNTSLSDTAPNAWGRRVIARAHAKQRRSNPQVRALTELDFL
jgi:serine/threonine-protein kinase HipA